MTDDDKLAALALIEADLRQDVEAVSTLAADMPVSTFLAVLNISSFLIRELATYVDCDGQAITDQLRADIMKGTNQ